MQYLWIFQQPDSSDLLKKNQSPEVEEVQKCEDTMDWRKHAYLPPYPLPHTHLK